MDTRLGSSALAVLALTAAMAARAEIQPGFYAGVGGGNSRLELGDDEFGVEANDIGYQLFGGYNFGRYFAIEAAYFDGGVLTESLLDFDLEFGISGFIGSAVGRLPISDAFALFAKVGVASYDAEVGITGFGSETDHRCDLAYAAGGEFSFGSHWGLRVEYQAIDLSDGDFDMLGVSGLYRF